MPDLDAPIVKVNTAAIAAAIAEGLSNGTPVRYIVVTCALEDGTFATGVPEFTGLLRGLQLTAQALGQLSESAGCPVTVMPVPQTGRGEG